MKKIINKVEYKDAYGNPQESSLGKNGVEKITEHAAGGEGDKWFYEVIFKDRGFMIFDPKVVDYKIIDDGLSF